MKNDHPSASDSLTKDEQFLKEALGQHLNAEVDKLDFNVSSKLAAARHRAMSQDTPESAGIFGRPWINWQKLGASCAVLALALFVGQQLYSPAAVTINPDSLQLASSDLIEDLPILSASDDIEFYQSIEFLEWMASNSG